MEGWLTRTKFLERELHILLGSITLIPPTVSMKPSSYLKVTAIMSLIITLAHPENRRGSSYYNERSEYIVFPAAGAAEGVVKTVDVAGSEGYAGA